jgi:serine protease Do
MAKKEIYVVQEGMYWGDIQQASQDAVVQVFAQVAAFNWQEPYDVEGQYENRGSGFLIDEHGHIVTNMHVIDEAKFMWVYIPALGRKPLKVDIVGIAPSQDIALLRLTENSLNEVRKQLNSIPILEFGDSDYLQNTESVMALGYPMGQHRLKSTTGTVSGRELISDRSYLQITTAINPGNSGGPLLNARGQVMGIITAAMQHVNSIGYAIPSNDITIILDDLYAQKLLHKPFLGANFIHSDDKKAEYLHNPLPSGLYITKVVPGSLCDKAGIQAGDMIYEFNGLCLDAYGEAQVPWSFEKMSIFELLARTKIGSEIDLVLYRAGKRLEKKLTFVFESIFKIRQKYPGFEEIGYETIGGMVVMELALNHFPLFFDYSPELIKYELPENRLESRLMVTHILPGSYTHQLGMLRAGDILQDVNGSPVKTLAQLQKNLLQSIKDDLVAITTEQGAFVVLSLRTLLDDEVRLSQDFSYPLSHTVQQLYKALENDKTHHAR